VTEQTDSARWIDLLDPTAEELAAKLPREVHDRAIDQLLAPAQHEDEPRPKLESHGDYVFGIFLAPVVVAEEDVVFYQEIDLVLTRDVLVTVRKTPADGRPPWDPAPAQEACRDTDNVAMIAYHLADDIAEGFLDLVDDVNEEIEELEDNVEGWDAARVRTRLSSLRHDMLHIRRTLAPTRDAIREVVDNRIEFEGDEVFTHDVELNFGNAYDKLLRAADNLELARDLVAGVRDYQQAKIANDQNEVMKRLAVIATLFLPLAFLTGFWGQNFSYLVAHIEPGKTAFWILGVGVELAAAIGLFALIKWRRWL
jgi:magnesium transporter